MFKKIILFLIFTSIFSQMLFLGEKNVIYANIISLTLIPASLIALYNKSYKLSIQLKSFFFLIVLFIIGYLWADNKSFLDLNLYIPLILMFIFLFIIYNILVIYKTVTPVMSSFWAITVFNFFILIGVIPQDLFFDLDYWQSRFYGTFNNPNVGAISFMFSLLFADYYLKKNRGNLSFFLIVFLYIIIILSFFLVIATGSKKGLLLLVIYFLSKLLTINLQKQIFKNLIFLMIAIFIALSFLKSDTIYSNFNNIYNRVQTSSVSSDISTSERLYFLEIGLTGVLNSPVIGHGFKSFQAKHGTYTHNNFVELLYSGGIIALFLYYIIYIKLLKGFIKLRSSEKELGLFSLFFLLAIDIAAVSYEVKFIQYFICVLLVILQINKTHIKKIK